MASPLQTAAHNEGIAEADDLKKAVYDLDKTEGHRSDRNQEPYKIPGVRGGARRAPKLLECQICCPPVKFNKPTTRTSE